MERNSEITLESLFEEVATLRSDIGKLMERLQEVNFHILTFMTINRDVESEKILPEEVLNVPIWELGLQTRTLNCLRKAKINTIGELINSPLNSLIYETSTSIGIVSIRDITNALIRKGVDPERYWPKGYIQQLNQSQKKFYVWLRTHT